ncbi:MAG: Tat pathway signal protein [Alphaproteobacteria bacterium]|nr:MAG: Tat pathway signal protein [Alphaproteobacteria bacterium]
MQPPSIRVLSRLLPAFAALAIVACAGTWPVVPRTVEPGWISTTVAIRPVGLGLPGGALLADGVQFAGGIELVMEARSPLHSLSDLKLTGENAFISVSDAGELVRGQLILNSTGRLVGVTDLAWRRLTLADGTPITDKADGDAEGLAVTDDGDLLISFERHHRIWNYGAAAAPSSRPSSTGHPDVTFNLNDGMEGLSVRNGGWRVAGESGGVWDCTSAACNVVTPVPDPRLIDETYRITGMDRDPTGKGFIIVQRSYRPPLDARAQIRRMAVDGSLGPVLLELKLPGTTDNFEGIAAVALAGGTRVYLLSDDNHSPMQRTLLLAFDLI